GNGRAGVDGRRGAVGDGPVEVVLLHVRQDQRVERDVQLTGAAVATLVGELPLFVVVLVEGNADLLHVVGARDACGGLADLRAGGEQSADQAGDDGDHHQYGDQREAAAPPMSGDLHRRTLRE